MGSALVPYWPRPADATELDILLIEAEEVRTGMRMGESVVALMNGRGDTLQVVRGRTFTPKFRRCGDCGALLRRNGFDVRSPSGGASWALWGVQDTETLDWVEHLDGIRHAVGQTRVLIDTTAVGGGRVEHQVLDVRLGEGGRQFTLGPGREL